MSPVSNTYHAIKFLNAASSVVRVCHDNKAKASRAIGLVGKSACCSCHGGGTNPLVVDDSDFLNRSEATKLVLEIAFLGADAKSKDA